MRFTDIFDQFIKEVNSSKKGLNESNAAALKDRFDKASRDLEVCMRYLNDEQSAISTIAEEYIGEHDFPDELSMYKQYFEGFLSLKETVTKLWAQTSNKAVEFKAGYSENNGVSWKELVINRKKLQAFARQIEPKNEPSKRNDFEKVCDKSVEEVLSLYFQNEENINNVLQNLATNGGKNKEVEENLKESLVELLELYPKKIESLSIVQTFGELYFKVKELDESSNSEQYEELTESLKKLKEEESEKLKGVSEKVRQLVERFTEELPTKEGANKKGSVGGDNEY